MNGDLSTIVSQLGDDLQRDLLARDYLGREPRVTEHLVRGILASRRRFGITRLGSLTRLDRAGVFVAQAVRPLSTSNAVSQGKGSNVVEAAASALMEALESWAAENIAENLVTTARACDLPDEIRRLYSGYLTHGYDAGWEKLSLRWIEGYELFTSRSILVPLALVDTVYTYQSPHPVLFPRSTTGLAAGPNLLAALVHAACEVLERASIAESERRPRSLPARPIDPASVSGPQAKNVLARLSSCDLAAGIWQISTQHHLPVFRCHVMESNRHQEIAPLPGEGFGCDFTQDRALSKALMEAAQARVTALAGAREDIMRDAYPGRYDREQLATWRTNLSGSTNSASLAPDRDLPPSGDSALTEIMSALCHAGAKAAIVVPLQRGNDPAFQVIRLVAPPLRHFGAD